MADYAHYGNPLKELDLDEAPKKFKDETVRDEKGRRRFHGAFTGGFSAGYFNSVDTKEGWTPSQFMSSRSNRANKSEQKPQDYMDTEDLGDLGFAPQRLQLQEGARMTSEGEQSTSSRAGVGSQRELLSTPLKRILKGDRDSVGVMILRRMGWRDGKGIGPKVCLRAGYGPQLPPFSAQAEVGPDDIEFTEIKGTDKVWGLGYTPEARLDLFAEKIDRERLTQTTAKVGGRRLGIRGQAFGVGAFEEDDEDIYAKDDMTQYAFEEVDHSRGDRGRTPKHPMIESGKKQSKGGLIEGFVAVEVHFSSSPASATSIVIPPNWEPKRSINKSKTITAEMTREQKVASLFHNLPEGSVFNFLSEDARAKIEETKKAMIQRKQQSDEAPNAFPEDVEEPSSKAHGKSVESEREIKIGVVDITALRPFAKDPSKQDRFDRFVAFAEKGHREMLASIQPPHFSAWEAALEKKDFEAALAIVRPKLGLTNRFEDNANEDNPHSALPTGLASACDIPASSVVQVPGDTRGPPIRSLKEFGSQTHARFVWHPASVLCKRFNVPDPYPGQEFVGIPASSLLLDQPQTGSDAEETIEKREVPDDSNVPSSSKTDHSKRSVPAFTAKTRSIDVSSMEPERERTPPAIDIFKMIFSDEEGENETDEIEDGSNKSLQDGSPDARSTPATEPERKNTGIFANIDLSLLNKRPPPKPLPSAEDRKIANREAEQTLVPMGPRPPPILAVETETLHELIRKRVKKKHKLKDKKRKKDSKSKKKKSKKKKEKHRKRKKAGTSSSGSESSSSDEEHEGKSSLRAGKRKKRKRNREHTKHQSSSSSSEDSNESSDEEKLDERLKRKLESLRSPL